MDNQKQSKQNSLFEVISSHKRGNASGVYSICSANQCVLEAAMRQAQYEDSPLLIEATSNQVNQFGGYTGMNPGQFMTYIQSVASKMKFPLHKIILGGDHLGPNAWQNESAAGAMPKAVAMVRDYVLAGFEKIHLDASMRLADDPGDCTTPLTDEIIANRAADLCFAAEAVYQENKNTLKAPFYVIGTEVPVPGGAQNPEETVLVTQSDAARNTIEITKKVFYDRGLQSAWERVIALVVQPGVEFSDDVVFHYQPEKAQELSKMIEEYEGIVYEAHSTDYQTPQALRKLVQDHFAILKVGPALTFAFREAIFALEMMEIEWLSGKQSVMLSGLRTVLEKTMLEKPEYWQKHYHGDALYLKYARKYSFSDRSRYYWVHPDVNKALQTLIFNLSQTSLPLTLLDQFMPQQSKAVVNGEICNRPIDLIHHKIMEVTSSYAFACGLEKYELELRRKVQ